LIAAEEPGHVAKKTGPSDFPLRRQLRYLVVDADPHILNPEASLLENSERFRLLFRLI
jgi:hypothetical protein